MRKQRDSFDEFEAKLERQMTIAVMAITAGWLIIVLGLVGFGCGLLVVLAKAVGLF